METSGSGRSGNDTVLRAYHALWTDAWKYFKNYAEKLPLTEAQWEEAVRIIPLYVERHPDHEEFARKTIITVFNELERRDKAIRRGEIT